MAINKKLIHFQTLANFEAQLSAGNILDTSICFIKDAKKIWTHGEFYDCSEGISLDEITELLADKQDTLESGTNIKTINNTTILGSGNIDTAIPYAEYNGTLTAITVTTTRGIFPTTLTAGTRVSIKILNNITSITTVNVNGTGAKNVYYKGNSLAAGTINRYNTYDFIYDSAGYWRIIGINTDTHYTAKNVVTSSSTSKTNATAANGSVYLNVIENSTVRSTHNIKGTGATEVTSDSSGNVTINTIAVQAVDTTESVDDTATEYATVGYVDSKIGDINTVLESIISGN